jgi:hypothetical protein
LEKSNEPLAVSVRRGVKTKYERGEMIIGEKDLGDKRREMVYPPQPEPRITTRSCLLSDLVAAVECSTYVARHLCPDLLFRETLI